jgi:DNA gyrase/topoisomerase IV subunit B
MPRKNSTRKAKKTMRGGQKPSAAPVVAAAAPPSTNNLKTFHERIHTIKGMIPPNGMLKTLLSICRDKNTEILTMYTNQLPTYDENAITNIFPSVITAVMTPYGDMRRLVKTENVSSFNTAVKSILEFVIPFLKDEIGAKIDAFR